MPAGEDLMSAAEERSTVVRGKRKSYAPHGQRVARILKEYISTEEVRSLHRRRPLLHFAVAARQLVLTLLTAIGLWRLSQFWLWTPLALLQGFHILGFIILLHEWVHDTIFQQPHPRWMRVLGLLYAIPSSLSASQFARWHMDHHYELGSNVDDPKRAYLTPKIVTRWYKALYLTPALFLIYAVASAREARGYPLPLRRRIAFERSVNMFLHLGLTTGLWVAGGFGLALRVHLVPLFLAFPIAFTVNRLGQHYDINPGDPLQWSTLVRSQPVWNFLFLWSNFHLEHHYYPRIPCYRLPALHRKLSPLYRDRGMRYRGIGEILWQWFVKNRVPHTNWLDGPDAGHSESARSASTT
jgi:fatty acid desaturase